MTFTYLGNKSWNTISREERYYCAELYYSAKENPLKLIQLINEKCQMKLPLNAEWEIGYEVCLYRDLLYSQARKIKKEKIDTDIPNSKGEINSYIFYPPKRTFDLAIFGEKHLIIIEAKVYQNFESNQMETFLADKILLQKLFGTNCPEVIFIGLQCNLKVSSKVKNIFGNSRMITWSDISQYYPENSILEKLIIKLARKNN